MQLGSETKESKGVYISFIVPVYNAGRYLQHCIDSILAQDFQNFELILINDGSTDDSEKICEHNSHKDSRIRYVSQLNKGPSAARNLGLNMAQGLWIAFVDADDSIGVHYASSLLKNCQPDKLSVLSGVRLVDYQGNMINRVGLTFEDLINLNNMKDSFVAMLFKYIPLVSSWGKIFNSQVIRKNNLSFDERFHNGEDRIFLAQYLLSPEVASLCVVNNDEYFYLQNPLSLTSSLSVSGLEWAKVNLLWNDFFDKLVTKFSINDQTFISKHKAFVKSMMMDSIVLTCKSPNPLSVMGQYRQYKWIRKEVMTYLGGYMITREYMWFDFVVRHFNTYFGFCFFKFRLGFKQVLMRIKNVRIWG